MGGVMMTQAISYKSTSTFYGITVCGTLLCFVAGYYLAVMFRPTTQLDLIPFLGVFLGLPVLVSFVSFYSGWHYKKTIVEYRAPEWALEPVQMTIDDAKRLPREYNRKYFRLVANSNFWFFFIPILLIILIAVFPLFALYENASLSDYIPILNAISMSILFSMTALGAFRVTSNSASADFNLPLIREAIKIAEMQSKVPGVCNVRVVLDKAEEGELAVYDNPRVVIRIESIEKEAYVESWSDDLRALARVLCRLYEKDELPQVVWWWVSTDRIFRKFVSPDENGYYVKHAVRANRKELGVKDVSLVTENAVALIITEYLKTRGESSTLRDVLKKLNAENH
jgi:hypothetical protein